MTHKRQEPGHAKGNKRSKLRVVKESVRAQSDKTRDYGSVVHYWHIQAWALEAGRAVALDDFKPFCISSVASKKNIAFHPGMSLLSWLVKRLHKYNIIRKRAETFVADVKTHC